MKHELYRILLAGAVFVSAFNACGKTDVARTDSNQNAEVDSAEDSADLSSGTETTVNSVVSSNMNTSALSSTKDTAKDFQMRPLVDTPTDYSDPNSWMLLCEQPDKAVDLFYIYPTVFDSAGGEDFAAIDDVAIRAFAQGSYTKTASAIGVSTNVFAPYYRQTNLQIAMQLSSSEYEEFNMGVPRTDIYAALDTYFSEYNNGRPFIFAGHSQGSCMLKIVLGEYMQAHPDYLERMVATYAVGYPITQEWLDAHPYLKFAEGADDTGVIISWNTEGEENADAGETLIVEKNALAINPISWRRDEKIAPASENLGSRSIDMEEAALKVFSGEIHSMDDLETLWKTTTPGIADARINLARGTVICTTSDDYNTETGLFGPASFHSHDYDFYYNNIMENAKTRIAAYEKAHSEP